MLGACNTHARDGKYTHKILVEDWKTLAEIGGQCKTNLNETGYEDMN
jgi:hypothetical protein